MSHVLDVRNLHVSFDDGDTTVEALRGIDLSISKGERVAIIGRSGSGKSTLLRVLSGLVKPDDGYVRIDDHVLGPGDEPERTLYQTLGLVFQDYGLVPQLTALQNVMCGGLQQRHSMGGLGRFGDADRDRARRLLEQLGLGDRVHNRSSKLSGGERQRVAIARLLFQQPPVMLLDEPVASLDIHWARQAVEMMSEARDESSTLVMVLHDLSMARQFADRVIYMHDGQILFDGNPNEACCRLENQPTKIQPPSADGSVDETHRTPQPPTRRPAHCPEGHSCDRPPTIEPSVPATEEKADTPGAFSGLWGKSSFYATVALLAVGLYIWAAMGVEFSLVRIVDNLDGAVDFGDRMFPPDFSVSGTVAASLVETIQMALIGTTLAAIVSLPLAVMAARNVAPWPFQAVGRTILNGLRTIPSIIWGLFFVAIVGLGPFPGILALTFYAAGYLGKFYYEGIESIDTGPLRSLRTVGASPIQQFRWGVFPQVLPLMLGYTLYMFEYNVRAASILGIVGAGGIGFYLYSYINNFQYDQAATALLLLLVVVTVIDVASSRLRAKLMD